MSNLAFLLLESAAAVADLGGDAAAIGLLDDVSLVAGQRSYIAHQRNLETYGALLAGEIARRSTYELGFTGLARREGFSTPEGLLQSISGSSRKEASKLVENGSMMADAAAARAVAEAQAAAALAADAAARAAARAAAAGKVAPPPPPPVIDPILRVPVSPDALWQAPIVAEVSAGTLSMEQASAIRMGLGNVGDGVTAVVLLAAVVELLSTPLRGNSTQLGKKARQLRDSLDVAGVARRELDRRARRYLTARQTEDGLVVGSFAFSGADGALWWDSYSQAIDSKKTGARRTAADPLNDNRTKGQIAADFFVNLLQVGIDADPGTIRGRRHPSVRVIVEESTLIARDADRTADVSSGAGQLDGLVDAASLAIVEAALCDTGIQGIQFDGNGQCLDLGRERRLFNDKQKMIFAVRDGGCLGPGCDKPPSWTEAHHINYWGRDAGKTDVADGVLLCRFHHALFHSNGWEIVREGGRYWLIPPKSVDANQTRLPMPSNTLAIRKMAERTDERNAAPPAELTGPIITMTPVVEPTNKNHVRFVPTDTLWDDPPG